MIAHGEFPETLYRSFDTLDFAQLFLNGYIRFGSVIGYRKIKGERQDFTEGMAHYTVNRTTTKGEFCSNNFYALCCHRDLDAALKTNHGKYIVELANPLYLAEEVTRSLRELKSKHYGGVEGVFVEYDKGEEKDVDLTPFEASRLTYCQKPADYSHENEFRLVFNRKEFAGNNLFICLKNGIGGGVIHDHT